MRKLLVCLVSALTLLAFPVHADPYGHGGYGHGGYSHHGGNGSAWAGLALFGAFTGMAIMAESARPVYVDPYYAGPAYQVQQPVYVQPAQSLAPPPTNAAGTYYYCRSSAMYYPYTKACPEGWQAVPATPQ